MSDQSEAIKWQIYTAADPTVERIIPSLAVEIGLNESIVLMQIAFWIKTSDNIRDGVYWTYQSMSDMKEKAFPYWSIDTIRRIVHKLQKAGYILIDQYNKRKGDNTQWYALEPDKLSTLKSIIIAPFELDVTTPYSQVASMPPSQLASTPLQDRTTLPETPSEINNHTPAPQNNGKELKVTSGGKTKTTTPRYIEKALQHEPMIIWLVKKIRPEYANIDVVGVRGMYKKMAEQYTEACIAICGAGLKLDDLPGLYAYLEGKNWPTFGVDKMAEYAPDYAGHKAKQNGTKPAESDDAAELHRSLMSGGTVAA